MESKKKEKQQTIKQHFVPQFYLKPFADSKGFLNVLDIKNKRLSKPRPYPGLGYKAYFYAAKTGTPDELSQQVENWLGAYEDHISNALPRIIEKIHNREHLDEDDRYTLSALMCLLWLRSPQMRNQLAKMEEDLYKKVFSMGAAQRIERYIKETGDQISDDVKAKMIETYETGNYRLEFNNAQHIRFMTEELGYGGPGFINMFHGQKWKIYIAEGKRRFVTSDSPVVEWFPPPKGFYGASFLERNKYFPLTPEIFIELTYPVGNEKIKRVTLYEKDDAKVKELNMLVASRAEQYAYSGDKTVFPEMLAARQNPGKDEKAFYIKYEEAWVAHRAKIQSRRPLSG